MLHLCCAAAAAFSHAFPPLEVTGRAAGARGAACSGQASAAPAGPGATLRSRSSTMMMAEGDDPAEVLGVRPGASPAELKAAYRERAKQWHPDLNPTKYAAQKFRLLTEASLPLHCRPAFRRAPAHSTPRLAL